jgi:gliding motility-associated-like protein
MLLKHRLPHFLSTTLLLMAVQLLITSKVTGQNIAPNPDFEFHTGLPNSNAGGDGTPDYFHNSGSGVAELPECGMAYMTAASGSAIMGISTYRSDYEHREYFTGALTESMVAGNTYVVSFEITNGFDNWYSGTGTNNIGVYFSTEMPEQEGSTPILLTPQFEMEEIIWYTNWETVTFVFIAEENYNYITFGNFRSDAATATELFYPAATNPGRSEYMFDNIYVADTILPGTTYIDTTLCEGSTYTLPDGDIVSTSCIDTTIVGNMYGLDSTIITTVTFAEQLYYETSVTACPGSIYYLPNGSGVTTDGIYTSHLYTMHGCDSIITTTVHFLNDPELTLLIPDFICLDADPLLLEAFPEGGIFSGTGVSEGYFFPSTAGGTGSYEISYTYIMNECSFTTNTSITVLQNFAEAGSNQSIQFGERFELNGDAGGDYTWSPAAPLTCNNCNNPSGLINSSTTFTLTSTNDFGCVATDAVTIDVTHNQTDSIFVPNTFTPNGDGVNDYFIPLGLAIETILHFEVFNRWGECMYRADNLLPGADQGWDGTMNDSAVQEGVYIYNVEVQYITGIKFQQSGNVTVMK